MLFWMSTVGKYTGLSISYLSMLKALLHVSVDCRWKLVVDWDASTDLEDSTGIEGVDAILVLVGFGVRGLQGKVLADRYACENNVLYLGMCLGMQIAFVDFARHVMNLSDVNTTEFDPNAKSPRLHVLFLGFKTHIGDTMLLGSRRTFFKAVYCNPAKLHERSDMAVEEALSGPCLLLNGFRSQFGSHYFPRLMCRLSNYIPFPTQLLHRSTRGKRAGEIRSPP